MADNISELESENEKLKDTIIQLNDEIFELQDKIAELQNGINTQ